MRFLSLILVSGLLSACATSYQPQGYSGGYTDMKLGKDIYQVSFKGNGYTGSDRVNRFFLRRCAELTQQQGYEYFALVNQEAEANQQITGTNYNGTATSNYGGGYNYSGTMNTTTITRHGRTGVIKLFKEGTQPPVAYEAKEILNGFQGE